MKSVSICKVLDCLKDEERIMKRLPQILLAVYPYMFLGVILRLMSFDIPIEGFWSDVLNNSIVMSFVVIALASTISLICMARNGAGFKQIASWALIVKVAHIPYYIFIFAVGVFVGLLGLIPVPFMIFLGLSAMMLLFVMDYVLLLVTSVYNFVAIHKARKAGATNLVGSICYTIFSLVFCLDVVVAAIMLIKAFQCEKKNTI